MGKNTCYSKFIINTKVYCSNIKKTYGYDICSLYFQFYKGTTLHCVYRHIHTNTGGADHEYRLWVWDQAHRD